MHSRPIQTVVIIKTKLDFNFLNALKLSVYLLFVCGTLQVLAQDRPNIVLINADDLGFKPNHHAWGGPPGTAFVGSLNSDIENGTIKPNAPATL